MSTRLGELISQASEFTCAHQYWGIHEEEALMILDGYGERNEHLANPLNRDPSVPYFRPRSTPLSGEEQVYGKFLIMVYSGHDESLILADLDGVKAMENIILSQGGIMNTFTTYIFAFVDGKLCDYEVVVTSADGSTSVCDNHKEEGHSKMAWESNAASAKARFRWR